MESTPERIALIRHLRTEIGRVERDSGIVSAVDKEDYLRHLTKDQLVEFVVQLYQAVESTLDKDTSEPDTIEGPIKSVKTHDDEGAGSTGQDGINSVESRPFVTPSATHEDSVNDTPASRPFTTPPQMPTNPSEGTPASQPFGTPPSLPATGGSRPFTTPPTLSIGEEGFKLALGSPTDLARPVVAPADDGSGSAYPIIEHDSDSGSDVERDPAILSRGARQSVSVDGYECINEYELIDEIGRGQYGTVWLAVHQPTGESRAIKKLPRSMLKKKAHEATPQPLTTAAIDQVDIAREIAIMKKMRHKNVVALYEVIDDVEEGVVYLVMQYAEQGPLIEMKPDFTCKTMDEEGIRDTLRQLVSGMTYLKRHKVVHRDIKPDNILVNRDGDILIGDFGMSEVLSEELRTSMTEQQTSIASTIDENERSLSHTSPRNGFLPVQAGTPAFMAPEVIRGDDNINEQCDIWSLGVTLYCMLFGKAPFTGINTRDVMDKILNDEVEFPAAADEAWAGLIRRLLKKDPEERITLTDLRRHPKVGGVRGRSLSLTPHSVPLFAFGQMPNGGVPEELDLDSAITQKTTHRLPHALTREETTDSMTNTMNGLLAASTGPRSLSNSARLGNSLSVTSPLARGSPRAAAKMLKEGSPPGGLQSPPSVASE